ncbi:hypothetical protein BCL69_103837 [Nitrosomonas communis]|nr:hypothetical protein BCL69_103837 [Nitrosomonas communis]
MITVIFELEFTTQLISKIVIYIFICLSLVISMKKNLILFIHGLGSSGEEAWDNFPELVKADNQLSSHYELAFYDYPTSLFGLPFLKKMLKIQDLAEGLRTLINHKLSSYESIVLVCHSLGGLIAQKYLIDEVTNNRQLVVKKLLLYAVPNNGAGLASIADYFPWKHYHLKQLCKDSDLIRNLNADWFRHNLNNLLIIKYVVAGQDRCVDPLSARSYWGNPDVEMIPDKGHKNVAKPKNADDLTFRILRNFVAETNQVSTAGIKIESVKRLTTESNNQFGMELIISNQTRTSVWFSRTKIEGSLQQLGSAFGEWIAKLHYRIILPCKIDKEVLGDSEKGKIHGKAIQEDDKYGYEFYGDYEWVLTGATNWKIYLSMPTELHLPAEDKVALRFIFEKPKLEILEEQLEAGPYSSYNEFFGEWEICLFTDSNARVCFSGEGGHLIAFIANSITESRQKQHISA